jgi:hypothetical protein
MFNGKKSRTAVFSSVTLGIGVLFYFFSTVVFQTGTLSIITNDPETSQFHEWENFWKYWAVHLAASMAITIPMLLIVFNLKTSPMGLTFGIIMTILCFAMLLVAVGWEIYVVAQCNDEVSPPTVPVTYVHPHCHNRNGGTLPDDSFFLTASGIGGYCISTVLSFIFLVNQLNLAQSIFIAGSQESFEKKMSSKKKQKV